MKWLNVTPHSLPPDSYNVLYTYSELYRCVRMTTRKNSSTVGAMMGLMMQ